MNAIVELAALDVRASDDDAKCRRLSIFLELHLLSGVCIRPCRSLHFAPTSDSVGFDKSHITSISVFDLTWRAYHQ